MRTSFNRILLAIFALIMINSVAKSQEFLPDTARIAYTNSDRTMILAKTLGGKLDTLIKSSPTITLSHLAVLASSGDGKSLLIGVRVKFRFNQKDDSIEGFVRANYPFTFKANDFINPLTSPITFGPFTLLKRISNDEILKPLPLGTLVPNEQEWYGTWTKEAYGNTNVWFYHGKFDGTGTVDSISLTGSQQTQASYHMTNFAISEDGLNMFVAISDKISQDKPRVQFITWKPSITGSGVALQTVDLTPGIATFRPTWNVDSSFGFSLRTIPGGGNFPKVEIGLIPNTKRDLEYYSFRVQGTVINSLTDESRGVPHSALPDTLHMFTGQTGNPTTPEDDKEVITPQQGGPLGNGGDIMFSSTGDSVVFITCDKSDYPSPIYSSIWIYDLANRKSYFVQNDLTKMERQPIFMGKVRKLAPPPTYVAGTANFLQTNFDFGSVYTDSTGTKSTDLSTNSSHPVVIVSAAITGTGASSFSLVGAPALPHTVNGNASQTYTVAFAPKSEATFDAQLVLHYKDSLQKDDSTQTINLHGVGIKRTIGSVNPTAEKFFSMTLSPNPFNTSTDIRVNTIKTGAISLELVNISGTSIYKSEVRTISSGEEASFHLDATSLNLAQGSYYLLLHTPDGDVMRKAMIVK